MILHYFSNSIGEMPSMLLINYSIKVTSISFKHGGKHGSAGDQALLQLFPTSLTTKRNSQLFLREAEYILTWTVSWHVFLTKVDTSTYKLWEVPEVSLTSEVKLFNS